MAPARLRSRAAGDFRHGPSVRRPKPLKPHRQAQRSRPLVGTRHRHRLRIFRARHGESEAPSIALKSLARASDAPSREEGSCRHACPSASLTRLLRTQSARLNDWPNCSHPFRVVTPDIPFNLTIGWIVRNGKAIYQHDERLIWRFIEGNTDAWLDEGCPFHLWLTSPACEILDVTFAMNLGWVKNPEERADLIFYQSALAPPGDSIYHPTLVGPDFFHKASGML
jgi:hypothetical protein